MTVECPVHSVYNPASSHQSLKGVFPSVSTERKGNKAHGDFSIFPLDNFVL